MNWVWFLLRSLYDKKNIVCTNLLWTERRARMAHSLLSNLEHIKRWYDRLSSPQEYFTSMWVLIWFVYQKKGCQWNLPVKVRGISQYVRRQHWSPKFLQSIIVSTTLQCRPYGLRHISVATNRPCLWDFVIIRNGRLTQVV